MMLAISSIASFLPAVLVIWYLAHKTALWLKLRHFEGPPLAGLTRLQMMGCVTSGRLHFYFDNFNKRYGDTARIGPRFLLTSSPKLIRRMNAVKSSYTRGEQYAALRLHPTRDNITSYRDENIHNQLRTAMGFGYAGKENPQLEADIDDRLLAFLNLIETQYASTSDTYNPLDLARVTTFFTLDAISKVAFGKTFGFLDEDRDTFGYIAQIRQMIPALMFMSVFYQLQKLLQLRIFAAAMPNSSQPVGMGRMMGFAEEVVGERFKKLEKVQTGPRDMLGSFISHGLTQEQLESETLTQITAGSDSSATAIRMTLFFVSTSPRIYNTLMTELMTAAKEQRLTRPILRDAEARQLPYLQACIREGLRMYPPVTGLLAKASPKEGDTITVTHYDDEGNIVKQEDKYLPPNVQIAWNSWGITHDRHVFGVDADVYRPERWFEADEERRREMEGVQDLVFGYGRFGCLGKSVATMELNKIIAEFLMRYTLQVADMAHPYNEWSGGFFLHDSMFVRCERRDPTAQ